MTDKKGEMIDCDHFWKPEKATNEESSLYYKIKQYFKTNVFARICLRK